MFISDDMIYIDDHGNECKVRYLPNDNTTELEKGVYYIDLVSMCLYKCIGEVKGIVSNECVPGCICKHNGKYIINRITVKDNDPLPKNSVRYVTFKSEIERLKNNRDIGSIMNRYINGYEHGFNRVKYVESKTRNSGNIYIPELKPTDDVLTRLIKRMIIKKQIILNDHKTEGVKDYFIDNLRSALNGTTKNTTISKFLDWCKLLDLDWRIEIDNDDLIPNIMTPLEHPLVIAKGIPLWEDFGTVEKGIYKVPLNQNDDPLKRLIKVAVIQKRVVPSQYKNKGSNPHLFNNMMSGLKRDSKMMLKYFIYWCEILELTYTITLTDGEYTEVADRNYIATDNINMLNEASRYQTPKPFDDDDDEDD